MGSKAVVEPQNLSESTKTHLFRSKIIQICMKNPRFETSVLGARLAYDWAGCRVSEDWDRNWSVGKGFPEIWEERREPCLSGWMYLVMGTVDLRRLQNRNVENIEVKYWGYWNQKHIPNCIYYKADGRSVWTPKHVNHRLHCRQIASVMSLNHTE